MTAINKNKFIVKEFKELGIYLAMSGEKFRSRSYENASDMFSMVNDVEASFKDGSIKKIKGIGDSIIRKLHELITTGKISLLEDLRREFPIKLQELISLEGVGPVTIAKAYKDLRVTNREELKRACLNGSVANLPRVGVKKQTEILESISFAEYKKNVDKADKEDSTQTKMGL